MITSFNHSGFVVQDLEKEVAFYRDVIGLRVLREVEAGPEASQHVGIPNARRKLVFMGKREDSYCLELVQYLEPRSKPVHIANNVPGAAHVCFNVKDLEQMYENMASQGVRFLTPLVERESSDDHVTRICYGQDPEGNWLEFIET